MTMNAETKTYVQLNKKAKVTQTTGVTALKATKTVTLKAAGPRADVPEGYASVTLNAADVWQDGSGYQMLLDEDATAYGSIIPETGGLTSSGDASADVYAEFEYKIPENADGSLTTTNIVLDASVTILIPAGVYDWCITNPTPGDRVWIASSNGSIPGRYDDFEFASGAGYEFQVTLGGSNDRVDLVIDDPTAPAVPTELAVTPGSDMADVAWVPGENNTTWNLRWRPWVDPALQNRFWDLPYEGYEEQVADWMIYDADGDGNGWGLAYTDDAQTDLCFYSASYDGGALSPDNWLFTPEVPLGGTLKFDAWQRSTSYPDKIMIYVCDNPDWESVDEFVAVSEFIQPTSSTAENFEIDLGAFDGMGVIAFRHYDCTDKWAIYVDNISVEIPGAVEPAEWTLVEGLTEPEYTIEGLTPETKYEVQVQGVGEDARTSDWTDVVEFTTLPEGGVVVTPYFVVGTFNGWDTNAGVAFDEEDKVSVDLNEGDEFKVICQEADGSITWYGGVDDNQVGYFLLNEDLMGVNINLIDGSNFKVDATGKYDIQLVVTTPNKEHMDGLQMIVTRTITGISTIGVDKVDGRIFDIMGRELKSVPENGIYIQNGKKYVK